MEQVSSFLNAIFIIITLITVWQFYRATKQSKLFLILALFWLTIQLILGTINFYVNETTIPPRFVLLIFPQIILILLLFVTKKGKLFIDSLDIKKLSLLHLIRVPVEIVLYYLFVAKSIPQVMTFEGSNFDIIVGLTAPLIYYLYFFKKKISYKLVIVWNVVCLLLLLNIIVIAILSTNTPFQQLAFNQPNIAIAFFPFNWLPSVIVPIVLLSHFVIIKQLITLKK